MTVGKGVGEGGDAAIGVDGEEKGFLLGVLSDVDFVCFVGDAGKRQEVRVGFLEKQMLCEVGKRVWRSEETRETNPSSSRVMEIFMPLGVWVV